MAWKTQSIEHEAGPEERAWLKEEIAEQEERFAAIAREMEALEPRRRKWYQEFFDRISALGFNADGDNKVRIAQADLPVRPAGRKDQVVWKHGVDGD